MIKNKKGFTLVELIIVIAVLGLLATIFVVGLGITEKGTTKTVAEDRCIAAYDKIEKIMEKYNDKLYTVPTNIENKGRQDTKYFPYESSANIEILDMIWLLSSSDSKYKVANIAVVFYKDYMIGGSSVESKIESLEKDQMGVEIFIQDGKIKLANVFYRSSTKYMYFYRFDYPQQANVLVECNISKGEILGCRDRVNDGITF